MYLSGFKLSIVSELGDYISEIKPTKIKANYSRNKHIDTVILIPFLAAFLAVLLVLIFLNAHVYHNFF